MQETIYSFKVKNIMGLEQDLSEYKGKLLLIVNTASKCGFTKQYAQLQELYDQYRERGLVILGFPANNFMNQEPGTDEEIAGFCSLNFGVNFPLFSKISVRGKDIDPLYKYLTDKKLHPGLGGAIKWNFTKILVSPEGKVIGRFSPQTKPNDPELISQIEAVLPG